MKRIAAAFVFGIALVGPATAQPPVPAGPPKTPAEAAIQVVERVCRPAADSQVSPSNFTAAAGLSPEAGEPPNLPMGIAGLSTWRAPTPEGRLYVMSGVFPEATTPSTCLVALYDTPARPVAAAISDYVLALKRGFVINPRYAFIAAGYRFTRYDRRVGDTLHSVTLMETETPKPGAPTAVFAAFVVDYGWVLHPGRAHGA